MIRRTRLTGAAALMAVAVAGAVLPGCGLKKRHRCTASASYAGRTISGRGDDLDDVARARSLAQQNLCIDYCDNQDPVVDAAARTTLGRAPQDTVERINTVRNPPVKTIHDACIAACTKATATVQVDYKCERTGIF
jgi:hypothetical protein